MKKLCLIVLLCMPVMWVNTVSAETDEAPDTVRIQLQEDDPVIAMIDSLMALKFLESNKFSANRINKYDFPEDSVPRYSEAIYKQRIKKLDAKTPMEFLFNGYVHGYIELYAVKYRKYTQMILGMTETYFPLFEQMLDKYGVPQELKYLPIVESALNPKAKSPAGAMGLWQFMLPTGKIFGLEVNSMIDERCDPIKATEAACKYLKYLHGLYNDWNMALAAYNAGPGTVNNAIRRSGGKATYWEIYDYLPKETRGYVPAFIGVNYVFSYTAEHNLYPVEPKAKYFEYDTIVVTRELDLTSVAELIDISMEELQFLNPVYKTNRIPKIEGKKFYLYLPKDKIGDFLVNEDTIYNHKAGPALETLASSTTHVVRSGEYLSTIANKYNVSVTDIKRWNNLSSNSIYKGQKLVINPGKATENKTPSSSVNSQKPAGNTTNNSSNSTSQGVKYYTVRSGDSLWLIAERNGVTVDAIKRANNLKGNGLQAGQKLKIPVKGNG